MAKESVKTGTVLSAEEVKSRKARSISENFCYISLVPLSDETAFTVTGAEGQFQVHKKYGESTMEFMNKVA